MRAPTKMTAAALLCLALAALSGCGGGASKQHIGRGTTARAPTPTPTTTISTPASFSAGYEQSWGLMKRVGAEILAAINEVKREAAKHQSVSNAHIASEFATFAAYLEPAVIGLQGLTPPAKVKTAFTSMAASAVPLAAALRSFSSDAAAGHGAQGERDIAAYLAYAAVIDRDAVTIYDKLGLT